MFDYTDKTDSIINYDINENTFSEYGEAPWTTMNNSNYTNQDFIEKPKTKFDKFLNSLQNYWLYKNNIVPKIKPEEIENKEEEPIVDNETTYQFLNPELLNKLS